MDGVLVVDKPEGITSHDVVAFARRVLHQSRIGHTGTLDPMATGVLPLACGRATRLVRFMSASDKTYEARIRFGLVTDTYDITGAELHRTDDRPTSEAVVDAIRGLTGAQMQTPPPYSAKRVGGQRAYDLARKQAPPILAPVNVRLHAVELAALDTGSAVLTMTCSAGFYIRSFAHDLGQRLGVGACLEALRRTRSGSFSLSGAVTLTDMDAGRALGALVPLSNLLPDKPAVKVTPKGRERLQHGQMIRPVDVAANLPSLEEGTNQSSTVEEWVRIVDETDALIGVGTRWDADGTLRPNIVLI